MRAREWRRCRHMRSQSIWRSWWKTELRRGLVWDITPKINIYRICSDSVNTTRTVCNKLWMRLTWSDKNNWKKITLTNNYSVIFNRNMTTKTTGNRLLMTWRGSWRKWRSRVVNNKTYKMGWREWSWGCRVWSLCRWQGRSSSRRTLRMLTSWLTSWRGSRRTTSSPVTSNHNRSPKIETNPMLIIPTHNKTISP